MALHHRQPRKLSPPVQIAFNMTIIDNAEEEQNVYIGKLVR